MLIKLRKVIFPALKVNKNFNSLSMSTATVPKEEKVDVNGYKINYVTVGTGPHHLLCMPGALGTIWTDFKAQVDNIDRAKFTLVAWDPPGFGKSRPPEREFGPDFYEKDADAAHDFMKALHISKYSLLGWSDGGITGMIHAAKYPDKVQKLVTWGSNAFILPQELQMYKKIKDINSWSQKMRQPMIDVYGKELFIKYWSSWVEAMENIYKRNNGDICAEFLKNVKCPTLIIYGEKDPLVDRVHVSHLHTNIEGSRIHLYPDGKHNVHIAYAEDFNKRVQEFLMHS